MKTAIENSDLETTKVAITISPISIGLMLDAPALSLVAEEQLFGERPRLEL